MFSNPATALLQVNDLEKQSAFYSSVLGLKVTRQGPGFVEYSESGVTLVASKVERGPDRFALAFTVEDVEEACRVLAGREVRITGLSGKQAEVTDPEGNRIVLTENREPTPVTAATRLNDVIHLEPAAMAALESHGIRLCGGCLVLLNSSLEDVAAYSGLSEKQSGELVAELNRIVSNRR